MLKVACFVAAVALIWGKAVILEPALMGQPFLWSLVNAGVFTVCLMWIARSFAGKSSAM